MNLWNTCHQPDSVLPACKESLTNLGLDYLDLYVMHWPIAFKSDCTDAVLFPYTCKQATGGKENFPRDSNDLENINLSHHVVEERTYLNEGTGGHAVLDVVLTAAPLRKTSLHERTGSHAVLDVVLTAVPLRKISLHQRTGGHAVLGVILIAAPTRKVSLHEGTGGHD
uniref:NADP-dependent oxidoreductase domain-containing protein n=1 Tax=Timema shepardi TaxID=629360 RepID=A0A7R9G2M1_TIMSH|nr:unnamed protein product [Timema shepardi]